MEENVVKIKNIEAAIEAILFAAGYPVKYEKIAEVLGLDTKKSPRNKTPSSIYIVSNFSQL